MMSEYKVIQEIKPSGLEGISDAQISDHWTLYQGYVMQVNKLSNQLMQLRNDGGTDLPIYSDRRRRYGFELNGMVLHEYYFSNLTADKDRRKFHDLASPLRQAFEQTWGSFENWKKDFQSAGKTRGIGWAILYADLHEKRLSNHFIAEHENGHIAGWSPILVLDVWEHAYMVDYRAGGRADYINAFFCNIDWQKVQERYLTLLKGKISSRV